MVDENLREQVNERPRSYAVVEVAVQRECLDIR